MTAEIAIMNKEAIALAADSAVTINTGSGRKIYNTVNKLFALTKYAPVGIMVYGRADLMGIPWESIIKAYRPVIGKKTFGTIDEYVANFLSFLRVNSRRLFPLEVQLQYFRQLTTSAFLQIRSRGEDKVKQTISNKGKASPIDVQNAIDEAVEEYLKFVASKARLAGVTDARVKKLRRRHGKIVGSVRATVFQKLPLSSKANSQLSSIPFEVFSRHVFSNSDSGVVIAGFGNDQIFPFLKHLIVGGVTDNFLRYEVARELKIEHGNHAFIKPFAQSEMVVSFMEGIDPTCDHVINSYWGTIMGQFPTDVANAVPGLSAVEKQALIKKLLKAGESILKDFRKKLIDYQSEQHISPVVDAIAVLPKDLLAEVAESLVNLTSFKRRISMTSAETVGGPIDVAVISRGDGFVWIKRKHYFKPELNPQFMSRYSGGVYGTPTPSKR
jgi:hypothetical protein